MKQILSSPYLAPGFYETALATGRHRAIVGGRWEETGRIQMEALLQAGLLPEHRLLDIGAGALRLGCKAVPYLEPGHYWATDASRALLVRGWEEELTDRDRLPVAHLIEDAEFALPDVPQDITHAICFAVFTHLPADTVSSAIINIAKHLPKLQHFFFSLFLANGCGGANRQVRQADGVVTHFDRPPYHLSISSLERMMTKAGFSFSIQSRMLPRGQVLVEAKPEKMSRFCALDGENVPSPAFSGHFQTQPHKNSHIRESLFQPDT